jgi:hypothetical protein
MRPSAIAIPGDFSRRITSDRDLTFFVLNPESLSQSRLQLKAIDYNDGFLWFHSCRLTQAMEPRMKYGRA